MIPAKDKFEDLIHHTFKYSERKTLGAFLYSYFFSGILFNVYIETFMTRYQFLFRTEDKINLIAW